MEYIASNNRGNNITKIMRDDLVIGTVDVSDSEKDASDIEKKESFLNALDLTIFDNYTTEDTYDYMKYEDTEVYYVDYKKHLKFKINPHGAIRTYNCAYDRFYFSKFKRYLIDKKYIH